MKKILIFFSLLLILSQTAAFANSSNNEQGSKNKERKVEIEINQNDSDDGNELEDEEDENEVEIENENKPEKNKFKIKDLIASVSANTIIVGSQTIKIDPNVTGKYKQVGSLIAGMRAHVKGLIIDGVYYAEEIVVDNKYKKGVTPTPTGSLSVATPTPTSTVTPTITPTITVTPTASVTPTGTITPTPTGINSQITLEENTTMLNQIIHTLQKLLNELKKDLSIKS